MSAEHPPPGESVWRQLDELPSLVTDAGGSVGNRIGDNRGQAVSVNTVEGDVHLHERPDYREFLGEAATRRLRHAAGLGAERIRDIRLTFHPADPERYAAFLAELRRHRLGLITGKPGRGRTHTAVHALAETYGAPSDARGAAGPPGGAAAGEVVAEVVADPDAPDAGLAGISVDSATPRYLDLTRLTAPEPSHRAAVRALVEKVLSSGIRFVVIALPGTWDDELVACRARLRLDALPRPLDVFHSAMTRLHTRERFVSLWTREPRVRDVLAGAHVSGAVRFVREVARTAPPDAPEAEEDHRAWIDRALKGFTESGDPLPGWSGGAAARDGGQETEYRRVLIQAVALLEGASSAVVADQTHRLAQEWGVPPVHPTPVSGEGFTRLLRDIDARVNGDRVVFDRGGHGEDALDHLWREHPGARTSFQQWGHGAVADLHKRDRVAVARRWLALARRHRDPGPVLALLHSWGSRFGLMWAAVPAVAEAAVSPELGSEVRSHLYRLATSSQPPARHLMVLEVCRIFGRVQPGMALTRLRHVADRIPDKYLGGLETALREIAEDPDRLQTVLRVLPDWSGTGKGAAAVGTRFLASALRVGGDGGAHDLPELMEQRRLDPSCVARVWWTVERAHPEAADLLWDWVDALARRQEGRRGYRMTSSSLLGAARSDPSFARALGTAVRRWSVAHTRPSPAVEDLRRELTGRTEPTGNGGDRR